MRGMRRKESRRRATARMEVVVAIGAEQRGKAVPQGCCSNMKRSAVRTAACISSTDKLSVAVILKLPVQILVTLKWDGNKLLWKRLLQLLR